MTKPWALRLLPLALAAAAGSTAVAHHGWSGYDESKPLTLTGVVRAVSYTNPHATVDLQVDEGKGKTWTAVLAPVSRMESRGIMKDDLAVGKTVTVEGYQDKSKPSETRIERITLNGKKYELR